MLKRYLYKIYSCLLEWKDKDKCTCALLLDGARRDEKSYIAEQFGKNEYESYILITFMVNYLFVTENIILYRSPNISRYIDTMIIPCFTTPSDEFGRLTLGGFSLI